MEIEKSWPMVIWQAVESEESFKFAVRKAIQ